MTDIAGLRRGDIVRHSRTMEVFHASDEYVELHDKKNPSIRIGLYREHKGSDRIEVLRKARPEAGAVITAQELLDTPWRRGTVIKTERRTYVLDGEGDWFTALLPDETVDTFRADIDPEVVDVTEAGAFVTFAWLTTEFGSEALDQDIRFTVVLLG